MDHTITHCHNVTVTATLAYRQRYVHHSMVHVELDSESPPSFVLSIKAIVCRTIPVKCKLSIRRLRCYRPVHSRAVDQLIPSHGPSSEAIAAWWLRPSRKTRSTWRVTHNQPISNRFTALVVATVATASDFWLRSTSYAVHNWLNLNRRSTNSPVTDCGDYDLSRDTHMLGGISKTVMVRASWKRANSQLCSPAIGTIHLPVSKYCLYWCI